MIRLIIPCASLPTSPPHPLILGNSRAATKSKPHQIWTEPTLFPIWRPSRNESSQKSKSIASQEELNDWQQISIRHRLQHWDFASKKTKTSDSKTRQFVTHRAWTHRDENKPWPALPQRGAEQMLFRCISHPSPSTWLSRCL